MDHFQPYIVRAEALVALLDEGAHQQSDHGIDLAAKSLSAAVAELLADGRIHSTYEPFAELLRAYAHLLRWRSAVRAAESGAERHQLAAQQLAADLLQSLPPSAEADASIDALRSAADALRGIHTPSEIPSIRAKLAAVPLPIPIVEERRRRPWLPEPVPSVPEAPPVAFVSFVLGNQPGPVVNVKPGVLCDLSVRVRLSRWPGGIQKLLLAPVHAEPSGVLDVPSFTFTPPSAVAAESPLTLNSRGRLLVRSAQHAMARPIQVKYQMLAVDGDGQDAESGDGRVVASVLGQPELSIESFDPAMNPLTGFRQVDDRLADLRPSIRRARLSDVEQSDFVKIYAAAGAIAAQALSDSLYPDRLAEADFQTSFRDRLRSSPSIGGELEEHPQAARGITDLSFHKIRLELKVSDTPGIDCKKALEEHGQQLQQYVVGSDRRSGLLVVLDNTPKDGSPSSVANDLDAFAVSPENGGGLPLLVGVVIVRGRLKQPSQLGRRRSAREPH